MEEPVPVLTENNTQPDQGIYYSHISIEKLLKAKNRRSIVTGTLLSKILLQMVQLKLKRRRRKLEMNDIRIRNQIRHLMEKERRSTS
jgi:hypothetical protein